MSINWGEPAQAPHQHSLQEHVHRPINWLTYRSCPSHSRDTDMLHMATLPTPLRHATFMCVVVNRAVRSADSYKTENTDDRKAKSREIRAMNCEAGTRERPVNLSPFLAFTCVSSSCCSLHTNLFSHKTHHMHTTFWIRHVMHTCIDPTLLLSKPCHNTAQARPPQ